jgi:hypothetical protein
MWLRSYGVALLTINHQPSTINHQPSTASQRQSPIKNRYIAPKAVIFLGVVADVN